MHDLPAADAIYHQTCNVNFRTGKQIPSVYATGTQAYKKKKVGCPMDEESSSAFRKVVKYLEENDNEQTTINDLIDVMQNHLSSDCSPYGFTHMKAKLEEHFKDQILITEINGKANVVTFRTTAESVMIFTQTKNQIQRWKNSTSLKLQPDSSEMILKQ